MDSAATADGSPTGRIFDIKRFAVHDGPGIRTTVFTKGCLLQCAWCHNPESMSNQPEVFFSVERCLGCRQCAEACPEGAHCFSGDTHVYDRERCTVCGKCIDGCPSGAVELVGRSVTADEVLSEVMRDRMFYEASGGGMTVSGGEPLAQPHFISALLEGAHRKGIHTCLDTSGFAPWPVLDRVRPWVDLFLYDVKMIDDGLHQQYTGVGNGLILDNLRRLVDSGGKVVLRCPIIPAVNDADSHFASLIDFLHSVGPDVPCELLPYHPMAAEKYLRLGREVPSVDTSDAPDIADRLARMEAAGISTTVS